MTKEVKVEHPNFLGGFDKIIANDALRPVMNGVYFNNGFAEALDEHKLVRLDLKAYGLKDGETNLLDGYFADAEVLKEIKVTKRQTLHISEGAFHVRNGKRILKTIPLPLMESIGRFPNLIGVIPNKVKSTEFIGFNASYVVDVQDVYRLAVEDRSVHTGIGLKISLNGPTRGFVLRDEKGLFTGMVMPLMTY